MDEINGLGGLFSTKGSAEISPVERLLNELKLMKQKRKRRLSSIGH